MANCQRLKILPSWTFRLVWRSRQPWFMKKEMICLLPFRDLHLEMTGFAISMSTLSRCWRITESTILIWIHWFRDTFSQRVLLQQSLDSATLLKIQRTKKLVLGIELKITFQFLTPAPKYLLSTKLLSTPRKTTHLTSISSLVMGSNSILTPQRD